MTRPSTAKPGSQPARAADLARGVALSGRQPQDLQAFLLFHKAPNTLAHNLRVAQAARELALRFAIDPLQAQLAGWLHDCSAVIPAHARLQTAAEWKVPILPEEAAFPLLLHQKLSVVITKQVFGIHDVEVLSAVGCHTTLKAGASPLDKVLFVADKLAWDQPGSPPYLPALEVGLRHSLERAALAYLDFLMETLQRPTGSGVLHPWAQAARLELLNAG